MTITGFLRGINVGGHHKVPMEELRNELSKLGCENVRTLLNSGNIVFETKQTNIQDLQCKIEEHLTQTFGFSIPVILRTIKDLSNLILENPFEGITIHKDIRLYVSFLRDEPKVELTFPYFSKDQTFRIISINDRMVYSILDLSTIKTPKGMEELEKLFGKNITTRNWNTILKISAV